MRFYSLPIFSLLMASSDFEILIQEKIFLASAAINYDSATRAIEEHESKDLV